MASCYNKNVNRPPLRDIARIAGVSEPTVSRVLNGRPGVADATRDRVVGAIEELGFDPAIPDVRPVRSGVVGIVAGDFTNPVFPTLVHHISNEFANQGYVTSVVLATEHRTNEERCIEELLSAGVDAIVSIGGRHAQVGGDLSHYQRLVHREVPLVLVNGAATPLAITHVRCDEGVAAEAAVLHLVQLGHERIGCITGSAHYIPTRRIIEGHQRALSASGLPVPHRAVAQTAFTHEAAQAAAVRLLDDGFTAFVTGNDLMALGAIQAARRAGLGVPDDVSVVGYDGTDFTAFTDPPLTTMRQPFEDMADLIAKSVLGELNGESSHREQFVFEAELVSRSSSGRPR